MKPFKQDIRPMLTVVLIGISFYMLLQNFSGSMAVLTKSLSILMPFTIGLCLAFIMNMPMRFLEEKAFASLNKRGGHLWTSVRRPLCLVLSLLFLLGVLTAFFFLVAPEIERSAVQLAKDLPSLMADLRTTTDALLARFDLSALEIKDTSIDWQKVSTMIIQYVQASGARLLGGALNWTSSIFSAMTSTLIGFVFSLYILSSKEKLSAQLHRAFYATMNKTTADWIFRVAALSSSAFSNFIVGQCTEALILGTMVYIGMLAFSMPYAMMISSVIALTALVPLFGAFIGTVFGALMILLIDPMKALWFVVFILVLQQFESNIIYPRVVGKSVGLPGIWVLFSVTVTGSLFGILGLLVSVPLCSVAYCLFREFVARRLKEKGLE